MEYNRCRFKVEYNRLWSKEYNINRFKTKNLYLLCSTVGTDS